MGLLEAKNETGVHSVRMSLPEWVTFQKLRVPQNLGFTDAAGNWLCGVKQGRHYEYTTLKNGAEQCDYTGYVLGLPHGVQSKKVTTPAGESFEFQCNYYYGLKDGEVSDYDANGMLLSHLEYNRGRLQKTCRWNYPTGEAKVVAHGLVDNKLCLNGSMYKMFDRQGNVIVEIVGEKYHFIETIVAPPNNRLLTTASYGRAPHIFEDGSYSFSYKPPVTSKLGHEIIWDDTANKYVVSCHIPSADVVLPIDIRPCSV